MAFVSHKGSDIDGHDGPSQLKQYMYIQSSLNKPNGYYLTALDNQVLNSPLTNDLLQFQLWCVQFYDGGKFTIASKGAQPQMMSSGSGKQLQLLRLEASSFPTPPGQLWTYQNVDSGSDGLIKATISPGNVLDIVGGSLSEGAQVQLYAQNGGPNQRFSFEPVWSYIQITGTDLVLEVDSNNQVICNTKSTSNDNQLWRLKYSWTDGNFQISAKSQQSMMMAYDHDLSLAVVHLSSGSTNIWKGDGNSVCTPRSHYLTTNGNTTAGSQVIISTTNPLQLDLLPQI